MMQIDRQWLEDSTSVADIANVAQAKRKLESS
jgi:hypothetical protein